MKPLLDHLENLQNAVLYFALDLSLAELHRGMHNLAPHYQHVKCYGLWGTFDDGLTWLNTRPFSPSQNPRFFMSLGSIFGNDHFNDAVARLSSWKTEGFKGKEDRLLLSMDATSDVKKIWDCYHDAEGLFEKFIRGGYKHSNLILGCEWYRDEDWDIRGVLQEEPLMHRFVLTANKAVSCSELNLEFPIGSEVDCYEGFKYPPEFMRREFAEAGFDEAACWKAPGAQICELGLLVLV